MKRITTIASGMAVALVGTVLMSTSAQAAGAVVKPPEHEWTFSGPFGRFDETQLQRGFKVFKEVCSACHAMSKLSFRNLSQEGGPGFTDEQVKALAATYQVKDGPNENGDMFDRPARPADRWPSPFPNKQASMAANGGAYPPDLSVIAKARTYERGFPLFVFDIFTQFQEQGVDYLASFLTGFKDPAPEGVTVPDGKYYNTYYPGHIVAMPNVLNDGLVEYPKDADGKPQAPETAQQYAKDVASFLMWVAEPHLEARKELAFRVMAFLIVLAGLLYFTKRKIWSNVEGHA